MERKSLTTFMEEYYPKLSQRALGKIIGLSDKDMSEIANQTKKITSWQFKKCADWMKMMHNVILTYDSSDWKAEQKYEKLYGATIRAKDREIAQLKEQVRQLQLEVKNKEQAAPILVDLEKLIITKHEKEKAERRKKK